MTSYQSTPRPDVRAEDLLGYRNDRQYYDYNPKLRVPDEVFTPLHGVRLTGGVFRRAFDANVRYTLNHMDLGRVLYWFDLKAGRKTDAVPYNGHFEWNIKGQSAGQCLMGAGNALRWEENPELRAFLDAVLDTVEAGQETDGFLLPIPEEEFAYREYPHYVRIWLTYGLIAAANSGEKRAFRMLRLWQDWFDRCPDLPVIRYLELAFQGVVASTLVYATEIGVDADMEMTRKFYEEPWRLAQFLGREPDAIPTRRQHGKEPHPHGTELEAFEGYLDLYRYSSAPYLLNAVKEAVAAYKRDWQHPGGGIIMNEHLQGNAVRKFALFYDLSHTYNEICSSVFWLGIHQRLHRLYPTVEEHVFQMEQTLWNIVIAGQNGDADITSFCYLDDHKRPPVRANHCCVGAATRVLGSLPEYLYTVSPTVLSCDVYASSEIAWQTAHQTVTVTQTCGYPENGHVLLHVTAEKEESFELRLRIPQYAAGDVTITVNGAAAAAGSPGTYVNLFRVWRSGDEVEFTIPFAFRLYPYRGEDRIEGLRRCAYTYGPFLLAFLAGEDSKNLILPGTPESIPERLVRAGDDLTFMLPDAPQVKAVPYWTLTEERFTCFPHFR